MAAAALLRSVASKMLSRAAAAPMHHHPSLVARGLHGGARSGPATYSLHSTAPPPHRLLHGRGLHSRSSPVLHTIIARTGDVAYYIAVFGAAIYVHCWYRDLLLCAIGHGNATGKGTWFMPKLGKEEAVKMHSLENHVKELDATVMDLKAEIAELKIALESGRSSQGKV